MEARAGYRKMGVFFTGLIMLALAAPTWAAWSHDSFVGNPVSVDPGHNRETRVYSISDGNGGTLHAWLDTGNFGVAMQHLDADGNPLWGGNAGIAVFNEDLGARNVAMCSDGAGGAFLAIEDGGSDHTDSVIYVQHVDANGNAIFTLDPIMATPTYDPLSTQAWPLIVADSMGGAFVVWYDTRNAGQGYDIYGQHVNAAGNLQWGNSGLSLIARAEDQDPGSLVTDEVGGFYMSFIDYNGVAPSDPPGGFVTHFDAAGSNAGFGVGGQYYVGTIASNLVLAGDGFGNVAIAYGTRSPGSTSSDAVAIAFRNIAGNDLFWFGQSFVASGVGFVSKVRVAVGPSQRIYVSWRGSAGITSQALDLHGTALWPANGISVDPLAIGDQGWYDHQLAVSSDGFPTYVWDSNFGDINAQQLDLTGARRWSSPLAVSDAPATQRNATVIPAPDGSMVFAWGDGRTGEWTINAQRVERFGYLGDPAPAITSVTDYPQDQGGKVRLSWAPSYLDDYSESGIDNYTVWNRLAGAKAFGGPVAPSELAAVVAAAGIDEASATAALADGWTYVDQVPAAYLPAYGYNAPTFADSVAGGAPVTEFMVLSHYSSISWPSRPASGLSVDNLAPGAPVQLAVYGAGANVDLTWQASGQNDGDLLEYHIYRAATPGVIPGAGNLVGTATDLTYSEPFAAGSSVWHYVVTAVDVHGNEGVVSNEAATPATSAVGSAVLPTQFALRGNAPNPFNPATEIAFDLPHAAQVQLAVFDIAGHRVATLLNGSQPAGRGTVRWDGRNENGRAAPSGIYFARMIAGEYHGVWKMMLAK